MVHELLFFRSANGIVHDYKVVTPIHGNAGIVVEKKAVLATSSTTWNVIQQVDLSPYFLRIDALEHSWNMTNEYCSSLNCSQKIQVDHLSLRIEEARSNMNRLIDLLKGNENTPKRSKRAVMSWVGKISRVMFGTMDEDSEIEVKELIEIAANNTNSVANLLANQTKYVISEFGNTYTAISKLEHLLKSLTLKQAKLFNEAALQSALSMLSDNIIQFELDTTTLIDSVLFVQLGILHTKLVLLDEIETLAHKVSKMRDAMYLTHLTQGTFADIIKVSELTIILKNGTLFYRLVIPLLDFARLDLYRATSLPIRQGHLQDKSTFGYIWPENRYFAIGAANNSYLTLSQESLDKCKRINKIYICKDHEPIRTIGPYSPCEVQLTVKKHIDFGKCKIKLIKMANTYWARMLTHNQWLFSTTTEQEILTTCKPLADMVIKINNTGVLFLPEGCVARTGDIRLIANQEFTTQFKNRILENAYLDVSNVLMNINPSYLDLVQNIMSNEILNTDTALNKHEHTGTL